MSVQPVMAGRDRLPWAPLLVLSGAAFATVTTELLPAALLPELAADLRVAEPTAGLLVGVWALTVAAVSVAGARVAGRFPRSAVVPALLLAFAVATAGTAAAPTFGWTLASRAVAAAVHGVLWSLLVPAVGTLVVPALLGRAVAVVLAGPAAAGVVGIPLAGAVGAAVGWRASFAGLAALLAVAALAVRRLHLPGPEPAAAGVPGVRRDLARVAVVAVGGGLLLTGHFAVYTYVAVLLHDVGGAGADARSALLLVFGLAGLAGIAVSGPLSDRHPRRSLPAVGGALAASLAALRLVGAGPAVAVVVVACWGAVIGLLPPVFQTRLLRLAPPGGQALAGAVGVTVLNLGVALGAAAGGLVAGGPGAAALPVVAAVVAAAATAVLVAGA